MDLSILGYVCNLSDTVSGEVDFCPTRSMPLTWEMKLDSSMTTEVSAPSQMQFSRKCVHYKESCEWEYGVQTMKQSRRVTRFWSLTASRGGMPGNRRNKVSTSLHVPKSRLQLFINIAFTNSDRLSS